MQMTPINPNKPNIKCYCNIQINYVLKIRYHRTDYANYGKCIMTHYS